MRSRLTWKTIVLMLPLLLFSGCHSSTYHYEEPYGPNTLVIQNDRSSVGEIWYAYVTPSSAGTWGPDLLGSEILYPGEELVMDVYECNRYYDIRVAYEYGPVIEQYDVWLSCDTTSIVSFSDW
jgi:hypothetical protein